MRVGGATVRRAVESLRTSQRAQIAVAVAVAVVVYLLMFRYSPRQGFYDLRIYRNAIRYWDAGHDLYGWVQPHTSGLGFTYPPFAALLMLPMAWLSWPVTVLISSLGIALAAVVAMYWLVSPIADRHGWPRWFAVALAVPLISPLEPVRATLGFGQVNLFLVLLVVGDLLVLVASGSRFAGVGVGLATAIKLTPGIFVVYLLLTRRFRAAAVATGTAAVATVLAAVVAPGESWVFWTDLIWHTERVGQFDYVSNQSIMGGLARFVEPDQPSKAVWLALVAVVAGVGLWRATRAAAAGHEVAGLALTGLVGTLASPISWTHHLCWIILALVALFDAATSPGPVRRRWWYAGLGAAVWLVFVLAVVRRYAHVWGEHWDGGLVGVAGESAYVIASLVLVFALPVRWGGSGTVSRSDPEQSRESTSHDADAHPGAAARSG